MTEEDRKAFRQFEAYQLSKTLESFTSDQSKSSKEGGQDESWSDILETLLQKRFSPNTPASSNPRLDETIYFLRQKWLTEFELMRIATSFTETLPISQVVPSKGVDRIMVEFSRSKDWFLPCAEVFVFQGRGVILFDGDRELEVPEFKLVFTTERLKQ